MKRIQFIDLLIKILTWFVSTTLRNEKRVMYLNVILTIDPFERKASDETCEGELNKKHKYRGIYSRANSDRRPDPCGKGNSEQDRNRRQLPKPSKLVVFEIGIESPFEDFSNTVNSNGDFAETNRLVP